MCTRLMDARPGWHSRRSIQIDLRNRYPIRFAILYTAHADRLRPISSRRVLHVPWVNADEHQI